MTYDVLQAGYYLELGELFYGGDDEKAYNAFGLKLREIESRIVAICRELLPSHRSAFGPYYERMLEQGRILTDADRVIVKHLEGRGELSPIIEICAGIGQLSIVLEALGFYDITTVEQDIPRRTLSLELARRLMDFYPRTIPTLLLGKWQACNFTLSRARLIICTNSVNSNTDPTDVDLLRQHLDRGGHLIWQPGLFGIENPEAKPLAGFNSVDVGHGVFHQWK